MSNSRRQQDRQERREFRKAGQAKPLPREQRRKEKRDAVHMGGNRDFDEKRPPMPRREPAPGETSGRPTREDRKEKLMRRAERKKQERSEG